MPRNNECSVIFFGPILAHTEGFRWLPSYYEAVRDLPDAERLRLLDAILDFGFGNEVGELPPLLNGYFRLITPTLEKSIKFEAKQKANGVKGGRPPKPKENPSETQTKPKETQTDFGENLAIAFAVDDAVADDDADDRAAEPPPPPSKEPIVVPFQGDLAEVFDDWLAYKKERHQSYKPVGLKALISQTKKMAQKYGDHAVAEVICISMANGYQGIVFDRLGTTSSASKQKTTFLDMYMEDLQG